MIATARTNPPQVVSREEWLVARKQHLARERELTRMHDQLLAERRELPWVKVEKDYVFEGPAGPVTLAGLFAGRSQLIVYHFMFGPGWEEGCKSCSFLSDHIDGANKHLQHHDVSVVAISRAPLAELLPFKARMGWQFPWVSAYGTDFNRDYHVSFTKEDVGREGTSYNYAPYSPETEGEAHGVSVFCRDEAGQVYHTYSAYARGADILLGAHNFLDLTPNGRNERSTMDWVRHHDRYAETLAACGCCSAR